MAYIGRNPAIGTQKVLDSLESQFNGVLTTFDLRYGTNTIYPPIASALIVSLGGVLQEPGEAYTVASDTITFATAPPAGADCWILLYTEFGGAAGATANLTVSNNLTIGNKLYGPANFVIDPAAIGDDTGTVEIKGNLTVQGTTTTINSTTVDLDHLSLGDGEIANFGDSNDLQIYHTAGTESVIHDNGTGPLKIRTNKLEIKNSTDSVTMAEFLSGTNGVSLYYDNSQKFETTASGAKVSGTLHIFENQATLLKLERDGIANAGIRYENDTSQMFAGLSTNAEFFGIGTSENIGSSATQLVVRRTTGYVGIGNTDPISKLEVVGDITITNGTQNNAIRTNSDGQLQFLRNAPTNNTVAITIDDETGYVGIGTDSPVNLLQLKTGDFTLDNNTYIGFNIYNDGSWKQVGQGNGAVLKHHVTHGFQIYTGADSGNGAGGAANIGAKFTVADTGNVGVGVSGPDRKLHVEGDIKAQAGAIILSEAGPSNIDHIWSDDASEFGTAGSFIFSHDTTYKSTASLSNVKVGHVYVDNGDLGTSAGNTQDLARFYANNGNATSIRLQAKRKVAGTAWESASMKIFCNTDATEQGYIEFNPQTTVVGDGNYDVAIGSNNGEIARFTTEGNVGIGTTNPSTKLAVHGTGTVASFGNLASGSVDQIDIIATADYPTIQCPSSADTLQIASLGNVQIAIDSNNNSTQHFRIVHGGKDAGGSEIFKIDEAGNFKVSQANPSWTSSTNHPILMWDFKSGVGDIMYMASGGNTPIINQMALVISDGHGFKVGRSGWDGSDPDISSSNEFFRITNAGNVGIGTVSTTKKLHVAQESTDTYGTGVAKFTYTDTNNVDNLGPPGLHFDAEFKPGHSYFKSFVTSNSTDFLIVDQDNSSTRAAFAVEGAGGSNKVLYAMSNGNVGIGTNDPATLLDVRGGNESAVTVGTTSQIYGRLYGSPTLTFVGAYNGADLSFSTSSSTSYSSKMIIKNGGNVGIGTATPAYKLEVEGDIKVGELGTLWFSDVAGSVEKIVGTEGGLEIYADVDVNFFESDTNVRKFTVDVNNGQLDLGDNLDTTTAQVHFDYHDTSYINGSLFGLGTTSPAANLQVEYGTGSNASATIRIGTANDLNIDRVYSLGWGDPSVTNMGMGPYSTTRGIFGSRHGLGIHVNPNDEFSVRSSGWEKLFGVEGGTGRGHFKGNVGIGTTDPQEKLHVEGNVNINGGVLTSMLTATIADDAYLDVVMPVKGGIIAITSFTTYDAYPQPNGTGLIYYDAGASRNSSVMVDVSNTLATSNNTATTVGTFTDGKTTIVMVNTTGTIRIWNRMGATRQYKITLL